MLPTRFRSPVVSLPCAVLLLLAVAGCSHALEVDVPAGFHGHVTVLCEALDRSGKPIHVGADGTAPKAVCPPAQTSLTLMRGGEPVKLNGRPHWGVTGDGIVLSIDLDVP